MFIENAGVARIVYQWRLPNEDRGNSVLHAGYALSNPTNDSGDLLDAVQFKLNNLGTVTDFVTPAGTDCIGAEVYVYLPATDTWLNVGEAVGGFLGTNSQNPLPSGNCALGFANTNESRTTGRVYLPILAVTQVDVDGLINTTAMTNLAAVFQEYWATFVGLSSATLTPVVWRDSDKTTHLVESIEYGNVVAYQRRRRRGVGI